MELRITIDNKKFMFLLLLIIGISAVGLVVAYGGTSPSTVGHTWEELTCSKCITNANLADNSVTGAKIQDGTITGTDIQDGTIASADIASIDGSNITGSIPWARVKDGFPAGTAVYVTANVCDGGVKLTTASTCKTTACYCGEYGCTYYDCAGGCPGGQYSSVQCSNSYAGRLVNM